MKYRLKKDNELFETDLWVMADRKYASGWKFCAPEKTLQDAVVDLKKEFEQKVDALYEKPIAGAKQKPKKDK